MKALKQSNSLHHLYSFHTVIFTISVYLLFTEWSLRMPTYSKTNFINVENFQEMHYSQALVFRIYHHLGLFILLCGFSLFFCKAVWDFCFEKQRLLSYSWNSQVFVSWLIQQRRAAMTHGSTCDQVREGGFSHIVFFRVFKLCGCSALITLNLFGPQLRLHGRGLPRINHAYTQKHCIHDGQQANLTSTAKTQGSVYNTTRTEVSMWPSMPGVGGPAI